MFKDRLREARLSRGMTQGELAVRIGVVKSTVAGYETGRSEPNMEKFAQIMAVLNVDANTLLRDEMAEESARHVSFSDEAYRIAGQFERLDEHGRHVVRLVMEAELEQRPDE